LLLLPLMLLPCCDIAAVAAVAAVTRQQLSMMRR